MTPRKNIINIIIIVLLLANVVTLGLFWFKRPPHPFPEKDGVIGFLSNELNFDDKQQAELKKLVDEHRNSTEATREKVKEQKDAFFDLMKNENISDSMINSASFNAIDAQRQMDISVFKHFQKIRALCNETQRKKFDSIIKDALHRMARPQGPPPQAGGPEGPPQ